MSNKTVLGLDIGVASIGWGLVALDEEGIAKRIVDHGVVTFTSLDNNKGKLENQTRRGARGTRRVLRRRKERIRRIKGLIKSTFSVDDALIQSLFHQKNAQQENNVIQLKVKGLGNELTQEELIRVLIHYSKNRGFKSNRKVDANSEKGKMKNAIEEVHKIMERDDCKVSQALLTCQSENGYTVLHNTTDKYVYGFERADVEDEIKALLDKQISFHLIDDEFKEKYLEIWGSQRDYSEGPASGKYKVDFSKMFGFCKFTGEKRISRACPSYDIFVTLQKLHNLRYFILDIDNNRAKEDGRYIKESLSKDLIQSIYDKVFTSKKTEALTYKYITDTIVKATGLRVEIVDLPTLNRKEFNKIITKYKSDNNIEGTLDEVQYNAVKELAKDEVMKRTLHANKAFTDLKKAVAKLSSDAAHIDIKWMDDVATILSYAKTDKAVEETIAKEYPGMFSQDEIEMIKKLSVTVSGTGSISLRLTQLCNIEMARGLEYKDAMNELGFNHAKIESGVDFEGLFPTVQQIEEAYDTMITQPNVKHTLVYLRKFYNTLREKYGEPTYVHIEMARELRNSWQVRMDMQREQLSNRVENDLAKLSMMEALGVKDIEKRTYKSFSQEDVLKFRLWNEQGGICMYSGVPIPKETLLQRNECEVDHILPFSRSFDDSYMNKVLVLKKSNQEKKNKTPFEWLGKTPDWKEFENRVKNAKIPESKKNKLLLKEDITNEEFSAHSLHATAYLSKIAVNVFKDILKTEDEERVRAFKGGATSYLRKYYQLNNLTHSLESKDYDRKSTIYQISPSDVKVSVETDAKKGKSAKVTVVAKNKYEATAEYSFEVKQRDVAKDEGDKKIKVKEWRSLEDQELYLAILDNDFKDALITKLCDKNIFGIEDYSLYEKGKNEDIALVIGKILFGIRAKVNEKNRNNHFHHTVDALLVAVMTRSMQLKITNFNKMLQDMGDGKLVEDEMFGMMNQQQLLHHFNVDTKILNAKFYIARPYDNFIEEFKIKVFERDEKVLREKLSNLNIDDAHNAVVKYPSYQVKTKVGGRLHADTIMGSAMDNGLEVRTIRKSVDTIKKEKDLEKIYDKNGGQKTVYEALKMWIDSGKKGKPTLKNGQVINKVKLIGESPVKTIKISEDSVQKGYAMIDSVARILVFSKEGSDKLHFVQISNFQYLKLKKGETDMKVQVWWGQTKNNEVVNYKDLKNKGYSLLHQLYPGQHIEITLKKGQSSCCKVIGFSSGMLEIGSILGDQIDLIVHKFTPKFKKQCYLTVSQVEQVKSLQIDILGNLNVV